jgi:hypothetical protein
MPTYNFSKNMPVREVSRLWACYKVWQQGATVIGTESGQTFQELKLTIRYKT